MRKNKNQGNLDLKNYDQQTDLSLKKMNFGLWLAEKRALFTRLIIIFLISVSVFFFSYSIYHFIAYYLEPTEPGIEDLVNISRSEVAELQISNPQVLKNNSHYDFLATLSNPNQQYYAHFNYCFMVNEEELPCQADFILPNEEKYLFSLNQNILSPNAQVVLKIKDLSWTRINVREIPNWEDYLATRLRVVIEEISLEPLENNLGDYLEFKLSNQSAYSYRSLPLDITYFANNQLVGVNRYIANELISGETRQIRLNIPASLLGVNQVKIRPNVNILADDNYIKYRVSDY